MQLDVWILTEDLVVAKTISGIFRSYDIIPQYFRSLTHLKNSLKISKYHLLVLDEKFNFSSALEKTIILTRNGFNVEVPNIGVILLEHSIEDQLKSIMQRFLKLRDLQKDNYKFHLLNQAFSGRNEILNMAKDEATKRSQHYDNLWNIISLFSLHEQPSFINTCNQVFGQHEKIEKIAFLVRDKNKWISQGEGEKVVLLDTLLNFNIREAAKRLVEEKMGKSVILYITDEELNLDKIIFIKTDLELNWFGLENYLSLLNNYFRLQELKRGIRQELSPSKFLEKLREVSEYGTKDKFYLEVSFKKVSSFVVNRNSKFSWPIFLKDFTDTLVKYSPNLFVAPWGMERVFIIGHAVESFPLVKLIENFPVWRFFESDKPLTQNLSPTVKFNPIGERERYALQN